MWDTKKALYSEVGLTKSLPKSVSGINKFGYRKNLQLIQSLATLSSKCAGCSVVA